ncbi:MULTISPECIES: hypothetical protein [Thermus]|uniref:Uncharacterized protein n=2 Tax=Thermus scotoductus TaxID=37636 RepID=A0A0N1KQF0_THESC|nr:MULTISPECIES: hypothetical protein [Thermus]ADW22460.1 conserved hypothetical protein [Thermus scotoductus SA-01]KPD31110.1 hypothetical protein AN926_06685 [Thermus scotoductus]
MRQHFLPFSGALALFLLVYAASRFALWGLVLAAFLAYLLYLGLLRWQGRLLAKGPSRAALERLAMREAWRKGGFLSPKDLGAFLPQDEAERLLEGLAARGLCRREGEGFRF